MNLVKKLSSKSFFVFNLVLIGIIFGFSLAFLSFSCSTPRNGQVAQAQTQGQSSGAVIPQNSLAAAEGLQSAFNAVSEKVLPSVVEVKTVSVQRRQSSGFNGIPWEFFFGPRGGGERGGGDNQEQEREYRAEGMGSGIIVRQENGAYYVLTNNHVVEGATEIFIATRDGTEYAAELIGTTARRDLAVVSFKTQDVFPVAELGDSDAVKVGDWAIAMGNPLGQTFSVTMGIVSAVGRTGGPGGNINDFIQTDAAINQGNSGGPLVNIRGEVIGINTWIASNSGGGSVGLGFAIPINNAKRTMSEIISSGNVSDGWLGVQLIDPDRELLQALGLSGKRGAFASQVFLGSPADKGGIRPGDFVTHVNQKEVHGMNHLTQMVADIRPGERAVFTAIRDGAAQDFTVVIEERTDEIAAENNKLWPGLIVISITDEVRSSLNLAKNAQGLYVLQVYEETPADIVGLRRGDLITAVSGTQVKNLSEFYKALREKTERELWFSFTRSDNQLDSIRFRR